MTQGKKDRYIALGVLVVTFLIGISGASFWRGYSKEKFRQKIYSEGYYKGYRTCMAGHAAHLGYADDLVTWVGIGNENI